MMIDVAIIAMNRSVPCRHGGMHLLKEFPMSLRTCVISLLASTMLLACGGNQPEDADSTTGPVVVEADAGPATTPEQPGNAAAGGVDACEGVDAQLTDARKHAYALLVAALDAKVKPKEVDVSAFLEDGAWSMVLASTPVTDPGYFFFEDVDGRKTFQDVWGGVVEREEVPGVIEWAKGLGMPDTFANCFVTGIPIVD